MCVKGRKSTFTLHFFARSKNGDLSPSGFGCETNIVFTFNFAELTLNKNKN
jgi:hypothetical protein